MTTTLALANQKGGVAKTTSVTSIGAALVERGQTVLLVDLDPQASLTFSLGVDPEDLEVSVHHVLTGEVPAADVVLTTEEGMDLVPASVDLAQAETALLTRPGRERVVADLLEQLRGAGFEHDWVVLDCPPSLGVLTVAGLTAADAVVVPLVCETLAHRGVGQLLDTVHDVRQVTNPALEVWGVLPTMYDPRTTHARRVLESITESYDLEVVEPPVPRTIKFAEAPATGVSLLSTASRSKGAAAYRQVAEHLLARSGARRPRRGRRTSDAARA